MVFCNVFISGKYKISIKHDFNLIWMILYPGLYTKRTICETDIKIIRWKECGYGIFLCLLLTNILTLGNLITLPAPVPHLKTQDSTAHLRNLLKTKWANTRKCHDLQSSAKHIASTCVHPCISLHVFLEILSLYGMRDFHQKTVGDSQSLGLIFVAYVASADQARMTSVAFTGCHFIDQLRALCGMTSI